MIIDCIGCLHGSYPILQGGDLLLVTGDLTATDRKYQYEHFLTWLDKQPYRKKVFISGNHDNYLEEKNAEFLERFHEGNLVYLCDSGTEFEGFSIWGSPWSTRFKNINPNCCAFTGENDEEIDKKFDLIPTTVDILITHSPPFAILDTTDEGIQVGSPSLMAHHISRLRPKLWAFSHIHEGYGQDGPYHWNNTKYVNCSIMTKYYESLNDPIRILLSTTPS